MRSLYFNSRSLTHCWPVIYYWSRSFKLLRFIHQVLILFLKGIIKFSFFSDKNCIVPWKICYGWNASYWLSSGATGWNIMTYGKWSKYIIVLSLECLRSVSLWRLAEGFMLFESAQLYAVMSLFLKKSYHCSEVATKPQNNYLLFQLYW